MTAAQLATQNAKCLGGWDIRAKYVNDVRAQIGSDNVLLLDSGDMLSGTYF